MNLQKVLHDFLLRLCWTYRSNTENSCLYYTEPSNWWLIYVPSYSKIFLNFLYWCLVVFSIQIFSNILIDLYKSIWYIGGVVNSNFKISISSGLLLVYRHTIDFCKLILYFAALLNLKSLEVFTQTIMS